jgi:pSer/pThr/pTyr-binding forkhead associated (FHA) protein
MPPMVYQREPMEQEHEMMDESESEKKKEFELIIQQYDGPQTSFFSVKEMGAKIGRHSSNQILILDESISRYHAEIQFKDDKFYLKDTGSTTGTFIKITEKTQILPDMIFEMGSNQFVAHITNSNNLVLRVIEGPSSN